MKTDSGHHGTAHSSPVFDEGVVTPGRWLLVHDFGCWEGEHRRPVWRVVVGPNVR